MSLLGKTPAIGDGELTIIESGAIVEYIINQHGAGRLGVAVNSPEYPRYVQWMHFAEGSAMTQFLITLLLSGFIPGVDQSSTMVKAFNARTPEMLRFLDNELARTPYFVGQHFTAADLMMNFPFRMLTNFAQYDLSPYPGITAHLARIAARPAYQKAMALADPPA